MTEIAIIKDGEVIVGEHHQRDKEDWWLCTCGSMHKGFPYKCPIKRKKGWN